MDSTSLLSCCFLFFYPPSLKELTWLCPCCSFWRCFHLIFPVKKKKKTLARGHRSHQGAFPTHWPFNQAKVQRCGSFLQPPLLAVRKGEVHQHKQRHTQLPVLLSSTGCQITMTRTLPCSLFFGPHTHEHSIYISLFDYFSLRQE